MNQKHRKAIAESITYMRAVVANLQTIHEALVDREDDDGVAEAETAEELACAAADLLADLEAV